MTGGRDTRDEPSEIGHPEHGLGYKTWQYESAGADSAQVLDESALGVTVVIPARAFARHDEASGGWVRPPGEFTVRIGRSSADLRLSVRVRSG